MSKFKDRFAEILFDILTTLYGDYGNSMVSIIKKFILFKNEKLRQKLLTEKVEKLTNHLHESSILMEEIEEEFQKQKEITEKLKKESETSRVIASMYQEEIDAVSKVLGVQLKKENKKSNRQALIWNIIFCIAGIVGGYFISKLLP